MTAATLLQQLKTKNPPLVIDVRTGIEFRGGHIPGAVNLTISRLLFKPRELPKDKQHLLVFTCEHGPRAVIAKSLVGIFGYRNCELLDGHMHGYRQKHLPVEK